MSESVVFYIPGLGDHYDSGRSFALKFWLIYGLKVKLLPVKWYNDGTYEQKLALVTTKAKEAIDKGYKVTLIGESAGASLAINAAAQLPDLHKIILIAGVNSSKLFISPHIQRRSPSFAQSAKLVTPSLKKINPDKIHAIRGLVDAVVSPRFNTIPGARSYMVWSIGHLMTIVVCLTVFSWRIATFIKD